VRRTRRKALTKIAATGAVAAGLAMAAAGPAAASYRRPIQLLCTAAADGGTPQGTVCALPFGVTTAPNSYTATIAVSNPAAGDTFALVGGSLPPGLSMPAKSGPGTIITGNPTRTGTYTFAVKATGPLGVTGTGTFQITVTTQGAPDRLLCGPADNGGYLVGGACVLPDAVRGQSYQGHLPTSHQAGGTLNVVAGALPSDLSLPSGFGSAGDVVGGSASVQGIEPTYSFTVQGTGDQGQPLYQAYQITVDLNEPLAVVLPAGGPTLTSGAVGQSYGQNFFLSGGAAPYTWALVAGALPPGLSLVTADGPRDANNQLTGTPTTPGSYSFTMRLTDYLGQQATQQFTLDIQ
jgi:hypothetical protein